jgi:penicillin-binding protein 1C
MDKPLFLKFIIIHKIKLVVLLALLLAFISYWFSLQKRIFNDPFSTVIYASNHELLGALIASDGQWRFPNTDSVPDKFKHCILQFEDKYFYKHPGFNPVSLTRALYVNIKKQKVVMGGSTLTMQVIRLSRKGKSRTVFEKGIEIILATRAEIRYSKDEILSLFASHAPFGSNVVGLNAASWRYFGRSPEQLSWAEMATLAVLPNAPSLIFPGKNHEKLLLKRNRLLDRLYKSGIIDLMTLQLSKLEPLPSKPLPLPQLASHLLSRVNQSGYSEKQVVTTIDIGLQKKVTDIVEKHVQKLQFNGIRNAAALVIDVENKNILAYVGNTSIESSNNQSFVDIINAPRSTGSILKPILYAAMLDAGEILPGTLVPDVPVMLAGYSPKNYSKTYDGAVHAQKALSRSLNIPAVFMLKEYGVDRFYGLLKKLGVSTLTYPAGHYGLSLILGGAEGKLFDIASVYTNFAGVVNNFSNNSGMYRYNDYSSLNYIYSVDNEKLKKNEKNYLLKKGVINAAPLWLTFKALLEVNRPEQETGWEWFLSSKKIAWKTGTSFGFRDAWAVGTTSKYVVAVWVGNADGEGRSGLTGVDCAAPVMFDIFEQLPNVKWFEQPYDEMQIIPVCQYSGHRATELCSPVDSVWVYNLGLKTRPCPYHQLVHLDKNEKYRVTSECESVSEMHHVSWFVLPPVEEWYFKSKNYFYKPLPPYKPDCVNSTDSQPMEFIYPKEDAKFFVPVDIDNKLSKVIVEVAHRKPESLIYWHLDGEYLGTTKDIHQMAIAPGKGKHILDLVDENGCVLSRNFMVK